MPGHDPASPAIPGMPMTGCPAPDVFAPEDFAPVFIVGFPRSGTTLLATMLSRHSQIAVPPETRFMEEVVDGCRDPAGMLARLAESRRCRDLGLDIDHVAARFAGSPPSYGSLFRAVLEAYAAGQGKEIVAEKSPIHLLHVPTLAAWFPKARFLLVVRDGRDCVLSLLKAPWAHDNLVRHCAEWRRRMEQARGFLKSPALSIHLIRYEDLIRGPERELQGVMRFLDLPYEGAQLVPSGPSTAVPEWESAWKDKAQGQPDPTRAGAWKRDAAPKTVAKMESVMREELLAWGYEVDSRRSDLGAILLGAFFASGLFRASWHLARKVRGSRGLARHD